MFSIKWFHFETLCPFSLIYVTSSRDKSNQKKRKNPPTHNPPSWLLLFVHCRVQCCQVFRRRLPTLHWRGNTASVCRKLWLQQVKGTAKSLVRHVANTIWITIVQMSASLWFQFPAKDTFRQTQEEQRHLTLRRLTVQPKTLKTWQPQGGRIGLCCASVAKPREALFSVRMSEGK